MRQVGIVSKGGSKCDESGSSLIVFCRKREKEEIKRERGRDSNIKRKRSLIRMKLGIQALK